VIDRRTFLSTVAVGVLTPPLAAQTPPAGKVPRIGILTLRRPGMASPYTEALMQGLRELGYVEGRNLVIEFPDAVAREERLPELAAGLVRSNVDVILVVGPAALAPARQATKTIPLVMVASSADPVAEGIAASLARPGGNITGLTYAEPDRFKKQLELLKSVAVRASRIAVLWDFDLESYRRYWALPLVEAGRVLGMTVQEPVRVATADDIPAAFGRLKQQQADAILVAAGGALLAARASVAELAIRHGLPAIAAFKEFPQAGLLMSYGPDLADINRRAAGYVDRILKGAKPGELPIELPSKFELVINQKTAKSLGLAIPQSLLVRANEVVQ
jgi:putative ABC transport system substrate-binding protein